MTDLVRFPCQNCDGVGFHQPAMRGKICAACRGKGYVLTTPEARDKARLAVAKRKEAKQQRNLDVFAQSNPELMEFMLANTHWSDFCTSMLEAIRKHGDLTERQLSAIVRVKQKNANQPSKRNQK